MPLQSRMLCLKGIQRILLLLLHTLTRKEDKHELELNNQR